MGTGKRKTWANSVDEDQMLQNAEMLQNAASDQGLHCATHPAVFRHINRQQNGCGQKLVQVW